MSFISRFVDPSYQSSNTAGLNAVKRALSSGLSISDIYGKSSSEGFGFGSSARRFLQTASSQPTFIQKYVSPDYLGTPGAKAGMSAVQRALASGLSAQDIQERSASQGFGFGQEAQKFINTTIAAQQEQQRRQEEQQRAFNLAQMQIQEQRRIAEEQMRQQQRQLQISAANQGMAGSGQVQFSQSKADRKKLTSAGTSGYFGRKGLRIKGLNISPSTSTTGTTGSFA